MSNEEQFADEEDLGFDDNQMVTEQGFVKVCSNNVEYLPITSNDDKNTLTSQKPQNESKSQISQAIIEPPTKKRKIPPAKNKLTTNNTNLWKK